MKVNALVSKTQPKETKMPNQEKLTEEERAALVPKYGGAVHAKALRIIDAQAAALDRVIAYIAKVYPDLWACDEAFRALAAAPAPEADDSADREVAQALRKLANDLAAANARVVELEAQRESVLALATERVNAANARAEEAERSNAVNSRLFGSAQADLERAESEAAALRAESEGRRAALFQKAKELATEWRRAEAAESRLAAANALLESAIPHLPFDVAEPVYTHLAACAGPAKDGTR